MEMIIELEGLFSRTIEKIELDEDLNFDTELFSVNEIKSLRDVHFKGMLKESSDTTVNLTGELSGVMVIEDSISLDEVNYEFLCKIDENIDEFLENNQNTIDILEVLWQNIVLEIPLKYTEVKDLSKYQGDGWKVISEEEVKKDNPFSALADMMKEE